MEIGLLIPKHILDKYKILPIYMDSITDKVNNIFYQYKVKLGPEENILSNTLYLQEVENELKTLINKVENNKILDLTVIVENMEFSVRCDTIKYESHIEFFVNEIRLLTVPSNAIIINNSALDFVKLKTKKGQLNG